MFRSSTILREFVQSLAKITLLLKYSVKLRRCILCGDVAEHVELTGIINKPLLLHLVGCLYYLYQ